MYGCCENSPYFDGIEGALQVVDLGRNLDSARQAALASPSTPLKFGKPLERKIHLGDGAVHAVMLQLLQEAGLQMLRLDQPEQRALGIGVGDDRPRGDLVSVGENDAGGSAVLHLDARDFA